MDTLLPRSLRALGMALGMALGATLMAGCAHGRQPCSYLPVGACAQYGDRTEDGVTLLLRMGETAAVDAIAGALRATGYDLEHPDGGSGVVRTRARPLGGDTTLVVAAQVTPVQLPEQAVSVVLTATYSVPSRGLRDVRVIQRPGEENPLYGRLRVVADTLRTSRASAP